MPAVLRLVRGQSYYHVDSKSVWIYEGSTEDDWGVEYHFTDMLDPTWRFSLKQSRVLDSLVHCTEMEALARGSL